MRHPSISIKVLRPLMFSVKNIVQNVKLIELWGNNLVPVHYILSSLKANFSDFSHRVQC